MDYPIVQFPSPGVLLLDREKLTRQSKRLGSLGIMEAQSRVPLKPLGTKVSVMFEGFKGHLYWAPLMPRSASISVGCMPDHYRFSNGLYRQMHFMLFSINYLWVFLSLKGFIGILLRAWFLWSSTYYVCIFYMKNNLFLLARINTVLYLKPEKKRFRSRLCTDQMFWLRQMMTRTLNLPSINWMA